MRRKARVDSNQSTLVELLRQLHASVLPIHMIGRGAPDIVIGYRGHNLLAEIKDPSKWPSARRLTPDESDWHEAWRGQIAIIETLDDCRALLAEVDALVCRERLT